MKQLWMRFPGFFYAVAILSGLLFYFRFPYPLLIGIWGKNRIQIFGFYLVAILSYLNTNIANNPDIITKYTKGSGYYSVKKIRRSIGKQKGVVNYQGVLEYFVSEGKEYYHLPCYATVAESKDRPRGDQDYVIKGKVSPIGHGLYKMHVDEWHPVPKTFSLAEFRFKLKQQLRHYLKEHVKDRLVYSFFSSLGTGEIDDRLLSILFTRAGISHTLAISGFHYTWLLITLWGFTSVFFPGRGTPLALLVLITVYFFFIGESPSLNRAWLTSAIYCFSVLIHRRAAGLNSLGVATAISLIIEPESFFSVGYQLSYIATFAILAIYPSLDRWAAKFIRDRTPWELVNLRKRDQILIQTACKVRQICVLSLIASFTTGVIALHHFGEFSWLGVAFNLFFPVAISISLLGIFVSLLPLIGPSVLALNEWYSKHLLEMVYWGISGQGKMLMLDVPGWFVVSFVTALIVTGMVLENRRYLLTRMNPTL